MQTSFPPTLAAPSHGRRHFYFCVCRDDLDKKKPGNAWERFRGLEGRGDGIRSALAGNPLLQIGESTLTKRAGIAGRRLRYEQPSEAPQFRHL